MTTSHQSELIARYQAVLARIQSAENIGQSIQLLAVSKTKPIEDILILAEQGQTAFGENYVQEALAKIAQQPHLDWHFIGPIQSNKTKAIAEHFNMVHSVDRLKIAERLSLQRPDTLPPLKILLEVNIDFESTKAGFTPDEILEVAAQIAKLPNLELRGLMAIPSIETDIEKQRLPFRKMQQLLKTLQQKLPDETLDTLSMGMSGDLEAAIAEGATLVRIGTDIFGSRNTTS